MVSLRINVDNRALAQLRDSPDAVKRALSNWQREAALETHRRMVFLIRSRQQSFGRTGQLANSVRIQHIGRGGFTVGPEAPHAIFFEEDTRPHEIRPRNKQALTIPLGSGVFPVRLGFSRKLGKAFTVGHVAGRERRIKGAGGAEVRFARVVHHPGTKGKHIVPATAHAVGDVITRMLNAHLQRELDALAGTALQSLGGA